MDGDVSSSSTETEDDFRTSPLINETNVTVRSRRQCASERFFTEFKKKLIYLNFSKYKSFFF